MNIPLQKPYYNVHHLEICNLCALFLPFLGLL